MYDAMKETYEEVTVFGKPMLFTCGRIDRNTVPKGMYAYDVRHDDEGMGDPCEIAPHILVNHWGTLISNEPIRLQPGAYTGKPCRVVDPETDWNYEGAPCTLKEYMEQHPPQKGKQKDYER